MKEFHKRPGLSPQSELTAAEQQFVVDHIHRFKPKKIVEVGVYLGGTSALILENIPKTTKLFSIDLSSDIRIGSACPRADNWWLFLGGYSYQFMEQIGKGVDFLILDADHELPGELLDFLMVFPFLAPKSVVIIHDINLSFIKPVDERFAFAPRILFSTLEGPKMYGEPTPLESNIGSALVHKKQQDLVSLFKLLSLPWNNFHSLGIIKDLERYFDKYYPAEFVDQFKKICQRHIRYRLLGHRDKKQTFAYKDIDPLKRGG